MGTESNNERRLAAIMFTDMVGYTALSQSDEGLALELLQELRELMAGFLVQFGGKEIKALGDGFLLEFPWTLAAVDFGLALQDTVNCRNGLRPTSQRFSLRIGIHLGDVEHRDGDVFGNGVNLAQRVQSEAGPGEVWFTAPVFEQVRSRFSARIRHAGRRSLKHIPGRVALYCVPVPGLFRATTLSLGRLSPYSRLLSVVAALALVGLFLLLAGSLDPLLKPITRVVIFPFKSQPETPETRDFSSGLGQFLCSALSQFGQSPRGVQVMTMT